MTNSTVRDLTPGDLAIIPYAIPTRLVGRPPLVEVLTRPEPCPDHGCQAVRVKVREVPSGRERIIHRLPHRPVTLITEEEADGRA